MPLDAAGRRGMHRVMRTTTTALILGLALTIAFGSGVAFDRWLHRPITAGGVTVKFPPGHLIPADAPPRPKTNIPPCTMNCEPQGAGESGDGELEPEPPCYTDGSIPCAAPGRKFHPYGYHVWDREYCRWYRLCQQET